MPKHDKDEETTIAAFLEDFGHGETNKLATARLTEIVRACQETGKKGSLTIRFDVAVSAQGIAEVRASVKTTKPENALPGAAFYAGSDGRLHTEDPRQTKLPLKSIPTPDNLRTLIPDPKKEN